MPIGSIRAAETWHCVDGKSKCRVCKAFDPVDRQTAREPGFLAAVTIRPSGNA